jgi:hypothetical protein
MLAYVINEIISDRGPWPTTRASDTPRPTPLPRGTRAETSLTKTLGHLLAVPEYKDLVSAIGLVAKSASVGDARRVTASIKNCNDVFVTDTGKRDEPAIGWLTNTLLAGVQ